MGNVNKIDVELLNRENNKTGKWTIFYDAEKFTEEKILNWIEEQKIMFAWNYEKMLLNLMIVKGIICVPTESTELLEKWRTE